MVGTLSLDTTPFSVPTKDMSHNIDEHVQIRILCNQEFEHSVDSYDTQKTMVKSKSSLLSKFYRAPKEE